MNEVKSIGGDLGRKSAEPEHVGSILARVFSGLKKLYLKNTGGESPALAGGSLTTPGSASLLGREPARVDKGIRRMEVLKYEKNL
jgi:hypothetical protein